MPFWHLQPSWRRRPMQEWDRQTWRNTENIHLGAYSSAFSVHRFFFSLLLLAFCSLSLPLEGLCEDVSERPIPSLYVQSLGEIKTFSVPIKQLIGHWNNRGNRTKVKSRVFHDFHPKWFSWFFLIFWWTLCSFHDYCEHFLSLLSLPSAIHWSFRIYQSTTKIRRNKSIHWNNQITRKSRMESNEKPLYPDAKFLVNDYVNAGWKDNTLRIGAIQLVIYCLFL